MSANCLMYPVIHTPPSFPHLPPPPPFPILSSHLAFKGVLPTCQRTALPAHDPNRLSKPSADGGGECRRTARPVARCLRTHSVPDHPDNAEILSKILTAAFCPMKFIQNFITKGTFWFN